MRHKARHHPATEPVSALSETHEILQYKSKKAQQAQDGAYKQQCRAGCCKVQSQMTVDFAIATAAP